MLPEPRPELCGFDRSSASAQELAEKWNDFVERALVFDLGEVGGPLAAAFRPILVPLDRPPTENAPAHPIDVTIAAAETGVRITVVRPDGSDFQMASDDELGDWLRSTLHDLSRDGGAVIAAEANVSYVEFVAVVDALREAGFERISARRLPEESGLSHP